MRNVQFWLVKIEMVETRKKKIIRSDLSALVLELELVLVVVLVHYHWSTTITNSIHKQTNKTSRHYTT